MPIINQVDTTTLFSSGGVDFYFNQDGQAYTPSGIQVNLITFGVLPQIPWEGVRDGGMEIVQPLPPPPVEVPIIEPQMPVVTIPSMGECDRPPSGGGVVTPEPGTVWGVGVILVAIGIWKGFKNACTLLLRSSNI